VRDQLRFSSPFQTTEVRGEGRSAGLDEDDEHGAMLLSTPGLRWGGAPGLEFMVHGLGIGFRVGCEGFRVQGLGCRGRSAGLGLREES
jgi:hypothetical protein